VKVVVAVAVVLVREARERTLKFEVTCSGSLLRAVLSAAWRGSDEL
jgi:hypothetical protein